MVASVVLAVALGHPCAAKLAGPDNQGVVNQSALIQVANECGRCLVRLLALALTFFGQVLLSKAFLPGWTPYISWMYLGPS